MRSILVLLCFLWTLAASSLAYGDHKPGSSSRFHRAITVGTTVVFIDESGNFVPAIDGDVGLALTYEAHHSVELFVEFALGASSHSEGVASFTLGALYAIHENEKLGLAAMTSLHFKKEVRAFGILAGPAVQIRIAPKIDAMLLFGALFHLPVHAGEGERHSALEADPAGELNGHSVSYGGGAAFHVEYFGL